MKDSDQVLNANQENITFRLQIPLSQKKIKAHSILVLRFKKKRKKKRRQARQKNEVFINLYTNKHTIHTGYVHHYIHSSKY